MCRCGSLSEDGEHHGKFGLLYGVDQRLAQAEKLRLFRDVADVNSGSILEPYHWNAVTITEGDKLAHLDQALSIELAAHPDVLVGIFRVVGKDSLAVADDSDQESINFDQTGVHFGSVTGPKLHVFGIVHQTGKKVVKIINHLLIEGNDG
ncbi:MAG: hypothetical protein A4E70_02615 [Syntrophus sp. PtaU1.Bin005]|nr:MAG: hypothetical protein A4E70_02615 [Syntrophus sp. PtaU1.Bin005]